MWQVVFLNQEVENEFADLPDDLKPHFGRVVNVIQSIGLERTGMPLVRHVRGPIWEMRIKGRSGIGRALYATIINKKIVILRIFIKKTEKTPAKEIEIAMKRFGALQA